MKFRKLLVLSSAVACALSLGGCDKAEESSKQESQKQETSSVVESSKQESTSSVAESTKTVKVGMGYSASYAYDEAKSVGTATVNAAFVAFDGDKVVDARIDAVQVKIVKTTAETGCIQLSSSLSDTGYVATKLELGTNYNMVKFGGAVAEVDAQIEAYADWTVGKTVSEITAGLKARTEGHYEGNVYTADDTLWTKCTITVDSFADAVKSAYDNRTAATYNIKDAKAGVAINGKASEASHGKGYDQVSVDINGVLVEGGKVVAAAIDAVTFSFKADAEAVAGFAENKTTKYYDKDTGAYLSKKVLGAAYAMAGKNGGYNKAVTLEWDEQAVEIEQAVIGKTAAEIKELTNWGAATITLDSYQEGLARAAEYAVLEHVGPQAEAK